MTKAMAVSHIPPWSDKASFEQAIGILANQIVQNQTELEPMFELASQIQFQFQSLYDHLDRLCQHTCPWCPDPCCLTATIWFDFCDLIFFQLNRFPVPPVQACPPLGKGPCRYIGPRGCRLPRWQRPWVCTRFICQTQRNAIRNLGAGHYQELESDLIRIAQQRSFLEDQFIRIITRDIDR